MPAQKTRLLLLLLALAAGLHGFRLSEPNTLVFDEIHFGGFATAYCCSGSYIFDIHPPHAKLAIAGTASLLGYRGEERFDRPSAPLDARAALALRLAPAVVGSLLPAVIFLLLLQLGASPMAALLGGLATLLDNAVLVQTRMIALDGFLLLSTFGAVSCFLASQGSVDRRRRTAFALAAGLLAGFAVGTKFTGLAALALIGACLAVDFLRRPGLASLRRLASQAIWVLSGAVAVYMIGWTLHFALLPEPGPGYGWARPMGSLLTDTVRLHQEMLGANYGLKAPHPYASSWWSWPLMARPVFYWHQQGSLIYLLGNPVVWWGSSLMLLVMLVGQGLLRATQLEIAGGGGGQQRLWIPLVGYAIAFAPLVPVPRALFLYHYMTPLLFGLCAVLLWLDRIGWTRLGSWRQQRASYHAVTALLLVGFLSASVFTFSFLKWTAYQQFIFRNLPGWR